MLNLKHKYNKKFTNKQQKIAKTNKETIKILSEKMRQALKNIRNNEKT